MIARLLLFLCMLALAGCAKRDLIKEDHAYIAHTLGSTQIVPITPPDGAFALRKGDNRYYRVQVGEKTYWIEAYASLWSLATDDTVWRYRIYEKRLVGYWEVKR